MTMTNCGKCGGEVSTNNPKTYWSNKGFCHRICPRRKHKVMKMGKRRPAKRPQGQRGFKRDPFLTRNRQFLDKRSYVSQLKSINGEREQNHLVLYGEDKAIQRAVIADRDGFLCRKCGKHVDCTEGEWHHVENSAGKRCDCQHNSEWRCKSCHSPLEHPQVQWSKPA